MGMTSALMTLDAVTRLETIILIELLCACQALDCDWDPPGRGVAELHSAVRALVAKLDADRPPADDVDALRLLLDTRRLDDVLARVREGAAV